MQIPWKIARFYSRFALTNRGTYALARWARESLPREQWNDTFVTPAGLKLKLDIATYPDCNMALGLYETDSIRLLGRLLKPGMHFVDCGANLGYFTLTAARLVGPGGRVDAFEPGAANHARLKSHISINGAENVCVYQMATDRESRLLAFYEPVGELNHGQASLYAALVPDGQPVMVSAARVDTVLDHVPDVIKVDVEGAELVTLQGAERFLQADRPPALIIEHNHESAAGAGYRPADLFNYLRSAQPKYRFYWIDWRLEPIPDAAALTAINRQGNILATVSPKPA